MSESYLQFELKGMKELDEALSGLAEDLQRKALQQAARAGAKVVQDEAKATGAFRDRTGTLRKSLVLKLDSAAKKWGQFRYKVGASAEGYYGYFIEKGYMATGPKKAGKSNKKGNARHVPASPFLRPALEDNIDKITEAIKKKLAQRIDYYANRYNKRPK